MKKFVKNRKNSCKTPIILFVGLVEEFIWKFLTLLICAFLLFFSIVTLSRILRTYGLTTFSVNFGDETLILFLVTITILF